MTEKVGPSLFYDVATSMCSVCSRRVDAKMVFEEDKVQTLKQCPQDGHARLGVGS